MNAGVGAGHHCEANVAGPRLPHEVGAPGRVRAHLHGPAHQRWVVTVAVAGSDLFGQLADRLSNTAT